MAAPRTEARTTPKNMNTTNERDPRRRHFGEPPMRDVERLRELATA